MAASAVEIKSAGMTVTYSGFTARILDITGAGFNREVLDTTHQGTTTLKTNTPSPFSMGKPFTIKYRTNDTDAYQTLIKAAQTTLTITYPIAIGRSSAKSYACTACITDIGDTHTLGQLVEGSVEFTPSGDFTETVGS